MWLVAAAFAVNEARVETRQPRVFTPWAMVVIHAYGAFLAIPVVAAALVMSVSSGSLLSVCLPIIALGFTAAFLPFGLGNAHIGRLVRSREVDLQTTSACQRFIVQVTIQPRMSSGIRALLEDADDIGTLTITETELRFDGDSLTLRVPWNCITHNRHENNGFRTLFVYGRRLSLGLSGVPGVEVLEFAERSSFVLWRSRETARRMNDCLRAHLPCKDASA